MKVRIAVLVAVFGIVVLSAGPVIASALDKLVCNGCVGTQDLASGAATSGKIRNGAVKTDDLDKAAVGRKKIKKGAVSIGKLETGVLMAARVNGSDGALVAGTRGVSSKRIAQGNYEVTMPVIVTACALTATHSPPIGEFAGIPFKLVAVPGTPASNVVTVGVWNDGTSFYADADFSVTVVCP